MKDRADKEKNKTGVIMDHLDVKKNQYGVPLDERVPSLTNSPSRLDKVSKHYSRQRDI